MSRAESMVETEIKLRVKDPESVQPRFREAGLMEAVPRVLEINHVFDLPNGEIRRRGELLRIREVPGHVSVTFKGKAQVGQHKSREELEISVSDYFTCDLIFQRLGFREIFRYEKYRTE